MVHIDKTLFLPLLKVIKKMTANELKGFPKALSAIDVNPSTGILFTGPYELDVSVHFKDAYDLWERILYEPTQGDPKKRLDKIISAKCNELYYITVTEKLISQLFLQFALRDEENNEITYYNNSELQEGYSLFYPNGLGLAASFCRENNKTLYRILPAMIVDLVFPSIETFQLYLGPYRNEVYFIESRHTANFRNKLMQILRPKLW